MTAKPTINGLPPSHSHKLVCVTDAKSAIRWFKQNASPLVVDPARIITGGGSAGGHISALVTLNPSLNVQRTHWTSIPRWSRICGAIPPFPLTTQPPLRSTS